MCLQAAHRTGCDILMELESSPRQDSAESRFCHVVQVDFEVLVMHIEYADSLAAHPARWLTFAQIAFEVFERCMIEFDTLQVPAHHEALIFNAARESAILNDSLLR